MTTTNFEDFYEVPNLSFDISRLKDELEKVLKTKKFNSPGVTHFGAIPLNQIPNDKSSIGRVRLLLKEPRSTLSWHKDPECRLHIPIITNKGCSMVIENVAKHLPANGKVWITNNTKYHNFFNGGEQARVHLVACVLESPFKD